MNNIKILAIALLCFAGGVLGAGLILYEPPEPIDCNDSIEDTQKNWLEQKEYLQRQLQEKQLDATTLSDEYYYCYWAYTCMEDETWCIKEREFTLEEIDYIYSRCQTAVNFDLMLEYWE